MAGNPRKRQQKLERKAAKRKEKKHLETRERSQSMAERMTAATRFPVLHSLVTVDFWDEGMGWALLSRLMPDGFVAVAVFLVDRYCLGVKNAGAEIVPRSVYEDQFLRKMQSRFDARKMTPAGVRKLVEAAVAYAHDLGFAPQEDYHKAKALFGDIDPNECDETFEFGKDGKPLFIAGPSDDPARCRRILATLTDRLGPNGFHFTIPMGDPEEFGLVELPEEEEDRLLEGEAPEE
jgi:hypothetical protein